MYVSEILKEVSAIWRKIKVKTTKTQHVLIIYGKKLEMSLLHLLVQDVMKSKAKSKERKNNESIRRDFKRKGRDFRRRVCVVSCSDVCLDQNRSEQHCPRQWAGGCHSCVNL